MSKRLKLAFVGGGSYTWAPRIIKDIMLKKTLAAIDFFLLDTDASRAAHIGRLGRKMNEDLNADHRFIVTSEEREAFAGCDFVIVCISTGGLDAMQFDLDIPEKYGIYQTVGDTVGPGGWSRNLRNVPVFNRLADTIAELSPNAVVLNYTNPMACLTKAFCARTRLRTVGLCHGLFENYEVLKEIFALEREDQLKIRFGGVNHFFWLFDFTVNGQDGYSLLRDKLQGGKTLQELINEAHADQIGFYSHKYLAGELFATFGYLPYLGDRHTCEFLPNVVTNKQAMDKYRLIRTSIADRRKWQMNSIAEVNAMLAGEKSIDYTPSRETAADIIEAIWLDREFVDVINVPNIGQIPSLPLGAIVETLGVINALGFTPLVAGPLPEPINGMVKVHAENAEMLYKAASEGNLELALEVLYREPSCAHLDYGDVRQMATELMEANRAYLPQFYE